MTWVESIRARQPGRSLGRIAWWHLLHALCYAWFAPLYQYRAWGIHHVPRTGPVLLVSNHQSFLDPIAVGLGAHHRQFYAMARTTLWDTRWLGWLIGSLNAVPVDQGGSDVRAMRQCLGVLNQNHALLVFPEGARTMDGRTHPFQTGTMLLIKRARPIVVPVAIEGAYGIWRRGMRLPKLTGRVGVMYGSPIEPDELLSRTPREALDLLQARIEAMRKTIGRRMRGPGGV